MMTNGIYCAGCMVEAAVVFLATGQPVTAMLARKDNDHDELDRYGYFTHWQTRHQAKAVTVRAWPDGQLVLMSFDPDECPASHIVDWRQRSCTRKAGHGGPHLDVVGEEW